ncbi:hypothetical protein [Pseudomonas sp. NMI4491_12]|uniref:hypothetical protein n=1 Tax=Pseudomonas sp. NMI4491_12 TaxID=2903146 RepID=UPI001E590DF5|nr:hypothetical protein [Pseudomonas sp. NMI4491_12]MCE0968862.1 hypothetical protein [Pseudomonas sp. NMI4491_12]
MKFLSRRNSKALKTASNPLQLPKSPGHIYAIINTNCSLCWKSSQELTKLANYCTGQGLGLHLIAGNFEKNLEASELPTPNLIQHKSSSRHPITPIDSQPAISQREDYPCQSMVALKILLRLEDRPEQQAFDFLNQVLYQIHVESKSPHQLKFYRDSFHALDINYELFESLITSPITKSILHRELETCRALGAAITPTVVWRREQEIKTLAAGVLDYEIIRFRIRQLTTLH